LYAEQGICARFVQPAIRRRPWSAPPSRPRVDRTRQGAALGRHLRSVTPGFQDSEILLLLQLLLHQRGAMGAMERTPGAFITTWSSRLNVSVRSFRGAPAANTLDVRRGNSERERFILAQPPLRPARRVQPIRDWRDQRPATVKEQRSRALSTVASLSVGDVTLEHVGAEGTTSYRVYLRVARGDRLERISPWHDLPLFPRGNAETLLFVNEIPKGTRAKMEIAKDEPQNPIKQDTKKGALRFYEYGPSLINYGALPQTWEDPAVVHTESGCSGDNDPLDVIEIGSQAMPTGAVYEVKPLGMLGLIDSGELDWKLIAIRTEDPKAALIQGLSDMEEHFPNLLHQVREWFRLYKTAEGKGENTYAYNGKALDVSFALQIVREAHENWRKLKSGERANTEQLALS